MSGYIGVQPVPQSTQTHETFTATSGQTSFATAGYTPGFLQVFLNGVKLVNGDDFTATNGSDVVLTVGAASGDTVEVLSFSTFEVNSQTFTGDTSAVNLNVTGTFTSRGIDDNATSTAMTLDGSGNVLVGKTSANTATVGVEALSNGTINGTVTGNRVLSLDRLGSDGEIIRLRRSSTTVGSIGNFGSYMYLASQGPAAQGVKITDNFIPATTSGANNDNAMSLGGASVRWKDLYLSGGVYLGGTGAANYLDDYEEGTWTPTAVSGLSGISNNGAYYTKVGNSVTIWLTCTVSGNGTTSQVIIGGIPFTNGSARADVTPWIDYANYGTNVIPRASIYSNGGATIRFFVCYTNSQVNQYSLVGSHISNSGSAELNLTMTYQTS